MANAPELLDAGKKSPIRKALLMIRTSTARREGDSVGNLTQMTQTQVMKMCIFCCLSNLQVMCGRIMPQNSFQVLVIFF